MTCELHASQADPGRPGPGRVGATSSWISTSLASCAAHLYATSLMRPARADQES